MYVKKNTEPVSHHMNGDFRKLIGSSYIYTNFQEHYNMSVIGGIAGAAAGDHIIMNGIIDSGESSDRQLQNMQYSINNVYHSTTENSGVIPEDQLRELLLEQLEYYFSKENLANDAYLLSQMDDSRYVPIWTVANFNQVKRLTTDINLITDVLRGSSNVEVDVEGKKVRPVNKRCVIILRETPETTPVEDIKALFNNENVPKPVSCEHYLNDMFMIKFKSEDETEQAHNYLREVVREFMGKPIAVRIRDNSIKRPINAGVGGGPVNVGVKNNFRHPTVPNPPLVSSLSPSTNTSLYENTPYQTHPPQQVHRYHIYPNNGSLQPHISYANSLLYQQQPFYHPSVLPQWNPSPQTNQFIDFNIYPMPHPPTSYPKTQNHRFNGRTNNIRNRNRHDYRHNSFSENSMPSYSNLGTKHAQRGSTNTLSHLNNSSGNSYANSGGVNNNNNNNNNSLSSATLLLNNHNIKMDITSNNSSASGVPSCIKISDKSGGTEGNVHATQRRVSTDRECQFPITKTASSSRSSSSQRMAVTNSQDCIQHIGSSCSLKETTISRRRKKDDESSNINHSNRVAADAVRNSNNRNDFDIAASSNAFPPLPAQAVESPVVTVTVSSKPSNGDVQQNGSDDIKLQMENSSKISNKPKTEDEDTLKYNGTTDSSSQTCIESSSSQQNNHVFKRKVTEPVNQINDTAVGNTKPSHESEQVISITSEIHKISVNDNQAKTVLKKKSDCTTGERIPSTPARLSYAQVAQHQEKIKIEKRDAIGNNYCIVDDDSSNVSSLSTCDGDTANDIYTLEEVQKSQRLPSKVTSCKISPSLDFHEKDCCNNIVVKPGGLINGGQKSKGSHLNNSNVHKINNNENELKNTRKEKKNGQQQNSKGIRVQS